MEADQQTSHERVRRELWAAIYRQEHEQSAVRVQPEFRFREAADYAVAAFDKRFSRNGADHEVQQPDEKPPELAVQAARAGGAR